MSVEIERRFLAAPSVLAECKGEGRDLVQGYLWRGRRGNARVRVDGERGWLTWKGPKHGCARQEIETHLPLRHAMALLGRLPPERLVCKTRYSLNLGGLDWVVDVFAGRHRGLIIAEVELARPDAVFPVPAWAVREVTSDPRYGNSHLATAAVLPRPARGLKALRAAARS